MQPLLDIDQISKLLGVSPRSIRRWAEAGTFPCGIRIGRRAVRWPLEQIETWVAEQPAANESENQRDKKAVDV